jgi:hypothetical protein
MGQLGHERLENGVSMKVGAVEPFARVRGEAGEYRRVEAGKPPDQEAGQT